MQKLIVGCGYLGRRVAQLWLRSGDRVAALTRSHSNADAMSRLGIEPIVGDVCDRESLAQLPHADTVLFAVGYDRSSERSQKEVYIDGLQNVLDRVSSNCRRFLYISSTSVYGESQGEWVDASTECRPVQPGGELCAAAERIVAERFSSRSEISADSDAQQRSLSSGSHNILRLSGIYGPGRLLQRIENLKKGDVIAGRADSWLNLIHVDDAAAAVIACEQRGTPGSIYLISDDRPILRKDYYNQLAVLVGAPVPHFHEDQPSRHGSGGLNKRCSNRKARSELSLDLVYPTIATGLPQALGQNSDEAELPSQPVQRRVE